MDLNITFPFGEEVVFSSPAHVVGWKTEVRQTAYYRKYTSGRFFQTARAAFFWKPLISHMNQRTQAHLPELTLLLLVSSCPSHHPSHRPLQILFIHHIWTQDRDPDVRQKKARRIKQKIAATISKQIPSHPQILYTF